MKKLTVQLQFSADDPIVVGQLAEHDRRIYFEYDASFLVRALSLSPFKLPLRQGLIEHADRAFGQLPGLFDDSLPDGWGLLLMDRMFRRRGIDPATVSPLDRLSYLGRRTMGALTYHPAADVERDDRVFDLAELGRNAQEVFSGNAAEILPALIRAGGSAAGARPKVLVGVKGNTLISGEEDLPDGFEHWIVKFSAKAESRDAGPVEFAYSNMARAAGIDIPPTRLFRVGKTMAYFGVKRFDRAANNRRLHMHTFANLIHANFRTPSTDYVDLLKVTSAPTRNHADVLGAFRQMVFSIAACNRDDHAKNFAFIMDPAGTWKLSSAYDLVYSAGPGGEHTMRVAGEGRNPTRADIVKIADEFAISGKDRAGIFEEVNGAVEKWPRWADAAGVTKKTSRLVAARLRAI
ncbi:MAG TPA: type II toxin-antitoxin system HipA family toxin [Tepidisphaeraceae bacterium]|jgi:serine/threonine-protein kinase HipA|nr:type II toxin-antitoxin system HipA family toxin [Tepidisphaeraceae bacterium]